MFLALKMLVKLMKVKWDHLLELTFLHQKLMQDKLNFQRLMIKQFLLKNCNIVQRKMTVHKILFSK